MEARAARFDEEDQLKKLRTQKVQERNLKLNSLNSFSNGTSINNSKAKEPACWGMCPEFEMIDRQVTNDVSLFEAQIPFNPPNGKLIIDPKRAIKKFRRSAAGNYELAEDLRPPSVLLATTVYLMKDVLGDPQWPANGVSFAVIYAFIRDRLRAIRTDLTLQSCKNLQSIRIHELSIRFLIASGHLLCEEERAAFEPQQNNEQLNGCLSALREMYKAIRLTGSQGLSDELKYEAEFQAYSIILSVDKKEAAVAISSLPLDLLKSEAIQVALEAYSAFQQTNFIKFLRLISDDARTSYLQACILHQFVLPIRQRALTAIVSLQFAMDCYKQIAKSDFIRWLAFVDEGELNYYSERFGFKILPQSIDLSALIQRGEAFDLRADEENFKIRKFQISIEGKRRMNLGLNEIIFQGIEIDFDSIMKVLNVSVNNLNALTSEFLAYSSSPVVKKEKDLFANKNLFNSNLNFSKKEKEERGFVNQNISVSSDPVLGPIDEIAGDAVVVSNKKVIVDQQTQLRQRLEAQAQERLARKEVIGTLSENIWTALLDSVVGFGIAEICTQAWDSLWTEQRQDKKLLIERASNWIYNDLIENSIFPEFLDIELMRIRCRAVESLDSKAATINQSTFKLLNDLENEIYQETTKETLLTMKSNIFILKKWFKKLKNSHIDILELTEYANVSERPVHLVFVCTADENIFMSSLLEPLIKCKPPNSLAYLEVFSKCKKDFNIKMLWSDVKGPFVVSLLIYNSILELCKWPTNFPGPTVLISNQVLKINFSEFPWQPRIIKLPRIEEVHSNGKIFNATKSLKEILSSSLQQAQEISFSLPALNQNLKISEIIPKEFISSFVFEPFNEKLEYSDDFGFDELLDELFKGLFERIIWTLFKCPQAYRLLSWHPVTAGRSLIIDSIRKTQSISVNFINLFKANQCLESTLQALDQIYGSIFTCNLESLYTNQTISEIIRTQNEIINKFLKRKRPKLIFNQQTETIKVESSLDALKDKLRVEASESEAYDQFLKKLL